MASSITLNTNLASQGVQRRLAQSTDALRKSFERLSSGLRINRASDDAVGLAIASSLRVDARIFTIAIRNVNDASSLYSIAEGAMGNMIDIVTRLKELAQQSANGTLSGAQRVALDSEAQALGQEYRRIAWTAEFNSQHIFDDPSADSLDLQIGYDSLSLSGGTAGDGEFAAAVTYDGGFAPWATTSNDMNGDGNIDLIITTDLLNSVGVLLGNGDGSFRARISSVTGSHPNGVATGDFNGDGKLDIVTADANAAGVSVLLGNGNGTFLARRVFATPSAPTSVTVADLNSDGKLDFATTSNVLSTVQVFLGNGDGSFRASLTNDITSHSFMTVIDDVSGDGKFDIVSGDFASGKMSVLIGNGDGTFRASISYTTNGSSSSIAAGDFNGDGKVDMATSDYTTNLVSIHFGNGNGTFRAGIATSANQPYSIVSADLNSDGRADIITSDFSGAANIFLGNGDGTFKSRKIYSAAGLPVSVSTSDFNGDNRFDLVLSNIGGTTVSVLLGNGSDRTAVAASLGYYSLRTQSQSREALSQFTNVLRQLDASIGKLGANSSRLDSVVSILQTTHVNYEAAASQILDVDVAEEAANLTRGQILQQAGSAVLAQANQQPALALQLLQLL